MSLDQGKLNDFVGKFVSDFGATLHAPTIILGEKLGLYKAMAGAGRITPARARRKDRHPREVCQRVAFITSRSWIRNV